MPSSSSSLAKVPGTRSLFFARCSIVREVVKPSAPALMRIAHQRRHLRDVVGSRGLVVRAALAHHVGAQRAVRHLRADVERARHLLDRVQVLGKAFPAPLDSFGERGAGNVLDAFHQADQKFFLAGLDGSEADAAIAHHDRGHAVPARRSEIRIPGDLAVVMRVDIDEAGRDQQSGRVDFAPRRAGLPADVVITPPSIATSPMNAVLPVPSTILPLRITRSCMLSVPLEVLLNVRLIKQGDVSSGKRGIPCRRGIGVRATRPSAARIRESTGTGRKSCLRDAGDSPRRETRH